MQRVGGFLNKETSLAIRTPRYFAHFKEYHATPHTSTYLILELKDSKIFLTHKTTNNNNKQMICAFQTYLLFCLLSNGGKRIETIRTHASRSLLPLAK